MICIIVCLVALVLGMFCIKYDLDEEGDFLFFLSGVFIISFLIVIIIMFFTMTIYPNIEKDRIEVQTLIDGIEDVRNANYKTLCSSSHIVYGNIENIKQSTNLSKYIAEVTKEKAKFNSNLKKVQIYEKNILYNIILHGFFISSEVQNIKSIK